MQRVHLALLREGERVRHHLRALSQTTEGHGTTEALATTTAGYVASPYALRVDSGGEFVLVLIRVCSRAW